MAVEIGANPLTLEALRAIARDGAPICPGTELSPGHRRVVGCGGTHPRERQARLRHQHRVRKVRADEHPGGSAGRLQTNLVLSHSAGTGALLDDETVGWCWPSRSPASRAVLQAFVPSWSTSSSRSTATAYIRAFLPRARSAPRATSRRSRIWRLALLGIGDVRIGGERVPAVDALHRAGLAPLRLAPKEGLAVLNGTQVSAALALTGLFAVEDVFAAAVVAGAMSVDAAAGSDTPFDPRIHALRGHVGQRELAAAYLQLLQGSPIRRSHLDDDPRVQDPYSLRCQPQVMGACLDSLRFAAQAFEVEANSVTDNPLVVAETGEVLSGGNFHAEPVALAADALAVAIAEVGSLAERRIALLIDATLSGLPPFLVEHGGVNSGFMVPQVTAAALASENKSLAHPASVDSLPTSANQEDHVSMATFAARRLGDMAGNAAGIVAIELLAAAQGIEFRKPLTTSPRLAEALALVREEVAFYDHDRYFAPDIAAIQRLVEAGVFHRFVTGLLPSHAEPR